MRKFEKISEEQYNKDLKEVCSYDDIAIPTRSTKHSAGYDFKSPIDFVLNPGESKKVPTGIKASMNEDEFLAIFVRSSMGFKYNIRLCNQVGIVDSDYYNNQDNEGHIFIKIQNEGTEALTINKGDRFAQGIFMNFLITDDDMSFGDRTGGFGSTGKGE
ncbi:MAG: deoxyuridine 5'-triphosphate nucleotidohydrolase [Bacilli bacterium]|nr:deoxyuridine 5'-triphosphate nucleotidohydrolase [Bacilli bacterium]